MRINTKIKITLSLMEFAFCFVTLFIIFHSSGLFKVLIVSVATFLVAKVETYFIKNDFS